MEFRARGGLFGGFNLRPSAAAETERDVPQPHIVQRNHPPAALRPQSADFLIFSLGFTSVVRQLVKSRRVVTYPLPVTLKCSSLTLVLLSQVPYTARVVYPNDVVKIPARPSDKILFDLPYSLMALFCSKCVDSCPSKVFELMSPRATNGVSWLWCHTRPPL